RGAARADHREEHRHGLAEHDVDPGREQERDRGEPRTVAAGVEEAPEGARGLLPVGEEARLEHAPHHVVAARGGRLAEDVLGAGTAAELLGVLARSPRAQQGAHLFQESGPLDGARGVLRSGGRGGGAGGVHGYSPKYGIATTPARAAWRYTAARSLK